MEEDGGEEPRRPLRRARMASPSPSGSPDSSQGAGAGAAAEGGGSRRWPTRRAPVPLPPAREASYLTCIQCKDKKARCSKTYPCVRCWRLQLPCCPQFKVDGAGSTGSGTSTTPEQLAEHVLSRADMGALGKELVAAFKQGRAKRELDPARVATLMHGWARLSAVAQRDVTHGVLPALRRMFDMSAAGLPSEEAGPTASDTRRTALAEERRQAEAAAERLRRLQGYQVADNGLAALHLLVLEEGGRVAHATNGAYDAAFGGCGDGVLEAVCKRRTIQPLLFAPYVDPEDRPLLFRLLVQHLCGARRPAPSNHFIKIFDSEGEVRLFLLQARSLDPASPLDREEKKQGKQPSAAEGVGPLSPLSLSPSAPSATPAAAADERGEPPLPRVLSGVFLRLEQVNSKYVSGRPLSCSIIQQFKPTARAPPPPPTPPPSTAAAEAEAEEGTGASSTKPCVPGLACLPLSAVDFSGESILWEMAAAIVPAWEGPVVVPDPGLLPPDHDEEEEEEETEAEEWDQGGAAVMRRERKGRPTGPVKGVFQAPGAAAAEPSSSKPKRGGRRKQQQQEQPLFQPQQGKKGAKRPRSAQAVAVVAEEQKRHSWEDGDTLVSAFMMATPASSSPPPPPPPLSPQSQHHQQRHVPVSALPEYLLAPVAESRGRMEGRLPVPNLTDREMEAIFDRNSDVGLRTSDVSLGLSAEAASAAVAAAAYADAGYAGYGVQGRSPSLRQQHPYQPYHHSQHPYTYVQAAAGQEQHERVQEMERSFQAQIIQHHLLLREQQLYQQQQQAWQQQQQQQQQQMTNTYAAGPSPWEQPLQPPGHATGLPQRRARPPPPPSPSPRPDWGTGHE